MEMLVIILVYQNVNLADCLECVMSRKSTEKDNSGEGCVEGVFGVRTDENKSIVRLGRSTFLRLRSSSSCHRACLHSRCCIFVGLDTFLNDFLTLLRITRIPFQVQYNVEGKGVEWNEMD